MRQQVIISVGREYGSGGHFIAEALAKHFGIAFYDRALLEKVAAEKNLDHQTLETYDERPVNKFLSRTVKGHSNSLQEHVAHMEFDYLRGLAEKGDSFVVVGRCSEEILKNFSSVITIFVLGDEATKQKRIETLYQLSPEEARAKMKRKDLKRKSYHNYYCRGKWGDSRNYDLSVNSSRTGIDKAIRLLIYYIESRMQEDADEEKCCEVTELT